MTFKTVKNLFKNNKEESELLNYFQNFIFNQQIAAPQKMPPGAWSLQDPLYYATVTNVEKTSPLKQFSSQWVVITQLDSLRRLDLIRIMEVFHLIRFMFSKTELMTRGLTPF